MLLGKVAVTGKKMAIVYQSVVPLYMLIDFNLINGPDIKTWWPWPQIDESVFTHQGKVCI